MSHKTQGSQVETNFPHISFPFVVMTKRNICSIKTMVTSNLSIEVVHSQSMNYMIDLIFKHFVKLHLNTFVSHHNGLPHGTHVETNAQ